MHDAHNEILPGLGDAIADYEVEFGEITAEEIARQRRDDRQDEAAPSRIV